VEACDERDPLLLIFAQNFPEFEPVRADPRFAEILVRLRVACGPSWSARLQ
jgi:hypothetical protein